MLEIREGNESEAGEIAAVINAAFEVERCFRDGDRTSADEVSKLMQRASFLVARKGVRMLGAVYVRVNAPSGYFGMLAVDPTLPRSGIGRALREAAERFCRERGCSEMTLSTGSVRRDLLPYYERFGYRTISVEPAPDGTFTQPMEVVKMSKLL